MITRIPLHAARYLSAADLDDHATALACFAPGAVVVDDGRTYTGDEVRTFVERAGSPYEYTRDFRSLLPLADGTFVAQYHLEGNFPGGVVDLRYIFTIGEDGLIDRLEITV